MIESIPVRRVGGWLLAASASVVAGISALLAFVVFLVARPQNGTALAIACALAAVALVGLIGGRKVKPASRRSLPVVPQVEGDDYSGLPTSPGFGTNALPFAVAGLVLAFSAILIPLGLLFVVAAAWADSDLGMLFGFAAAAAGPVILIASWVLRR